MLIATSTNDGDKVEINCCSLVAAMQAAARDASAPDFPAGGWSAACDGGFLRRDAGMPVVLFGPGSIVNQAHRADEFVPLSETLTAARAYAVLATRVLAGITR